MGRSERIDNRVRNEFAVEDANLIGKAKPLRRDHDPVQVPAGIEYFARLISLGADHEIICFREYCVAFATDDTSRSDYMPLIVRRVEQRALHRINSIHERAAALQIHRSER